MMSDMVTHWASFEDCRRLAQLDDAIDPLFKEMLAAQADAGRLGTIVTGGNTWMPPLTAKLRDRHEAGNWTGADARNLALVLGCLIHQACDFAMKPLLSRTSGHDWNKMQADMASGAAAKESQSVTQEISAYYDAEVFRQVYLAGSAEPLNRFFLTEVSAQGAEFERFVRATFQRALLSSHTLKPDMDNFEAWVANLFAKVQPLYLDVDLWVRVYNHPDPAKIAAYGVRTDFYDPSDPSILAARALQAGTIVDPGLHAQVFGKRAFRCAYGEVLQVGLDYLRNATRYWRHEAPVLASPNDVHQKAALEKAG